VWTSKERRNSLLSSSPDPSQLFPSPRTFSHLPAFRPPQLALSSLTQTRRSFRLLNTKLPRSDLSFAPPLFHTSPFSLTEAPLSYLRAPVKVNADTPNLLDLVSQIESFRPVLYQPALPPRPRERKRTTIARATPFLFSFRLFPTSVLFHKYSFLSRGVSDQNGFCSPSHQGPVIWQV